MRSICRGTRPSRSSRGTGLPPGGHPSDGAQVKTSRQSALLPLHEHQRHPEFSLHNINRLSLVRARLRLPTCSHRNFLVETRLHLVEAGSSRS